MKIGILTLPLHTNYGGILQAYALQTVLERMGHEAYIIHLKRDEIPNFSWKKKILCYTKRFLFRYILGKKTFPVFFEENERKALPRIRQNTNRFIKKYINYYFINSFEDIGNEKIFDAYVVGSDQIWRKNCSPWSIENSFLQFDKRSDTLKIAYAASFGFDKWDFSIEQTEICKELAQRFDTISVREKSGVELCKKYLGVCAKWVLDPTMLLTVKDYQKLVDEVKVPESEGKLMVYILDMEKEKAWIVNEIAKKRGLTPFNVNKRVYDYFAPIEERIQPPVESWLRGFTDAEFVITDSYHGCVFSILFHKPFIVLWNEGRGLERIKSLLEMFNLKDRLIASPQDATKIQNDIDWEIIDGILEEKRKESIATILPLFHTFLPKSNNNR